MIAQEVRDRQIGMCGTYVGLRAPHSMALSPCFAASASVD